MISFPQCQPYWRSDGVDFRFPVSRRICLAGLYLRGQYLREGGDAYQQAPSGLMSIRYGSDLDAGTLKNDNWYASFMVNTGQTVSGKLVTLIRVLSVSSSTITLAAHFPSGLSSINYGFSSDCYAGSNFVVITGNAFGLFGTVISNSSTTLTLSSATAVSAGDWIMVAPSGFRPGQYAFAGAVLRDTSESKNFYRCGETVFSDQNYGNIYNSALSAGTWTAFDAHPFVSPTACGIRFWSGIQRPSTGTSPNWIYGSADSGSHTLGNYIMPGYTSGQSVLGWQWYLPIDTLGKFYLKTDAAIDVLQIRSNGYVEQCESRQKIARGRKRLPMGTGMHRGIRSPETLSVPVPIGTI